MMTSHACEDDHELADWQNDRGEVAAWVHRAVAVHLSTVEDVADFSREAKRHIRELLGIGSRAGRTPAQLADAIKKVCATCAQRRLARDSEPSEPPTPAEALKQRLHVRLVEIYEPLIRRAGMPVEARLWARMPTVAGLEVLDHDPKLSATLLGCDARRGMPDWTSLRYLCGPAPACEPMSSFTPRAGSRPFYGPYALPVSPWARWVSNVSWRVDSVSDAWHWAIPAGVWHAQAERRRREVFGHVILVEQPGWRGVDDFRDLPKGYTWDARTRTLRLGKRGNSISTRVGFAARAFTTKLGPLGRAPVPAPLWIAGR